MESSDNANVGPEKVTGGAQPKEAPRSNPPNTQPKQSKWGVLRAKRAAAKFLLGTRKSGTTIESVLSDGSSDPLVIDEKIGFMSAWKVLSGTVQQNCIWRLEGGDNEFAHSPTTGLIPGVKVHSGLRFVTCDASRDFGAAASVDGEVFMWGALKLEDERPAMWSPPKDPNIPANRYDAKISGDWPSLHANKEAAEKQWIPVADWDGDMACPHALDLHRLEMKFLVKTIACGARHVLGALQGGGAISWGDNRRNQLGVPDCPKTNFPVEIPALVGIHIETISAGSYHNAIIQSGGHTWSWGHGQYGRLGHDDQTSRSEPTLIADLKYVSVKKIACGCAHTLALAMDGRLYSWGYGDNGALGRDNRMGGWRPGLVDIGPCSHIAASGISMAITKAGVLFVWGQSKWIGHNAAVEAGIPTTPDWLKKEQLVHVACGIEHAVVLTMDGRMLIWGHRKRFPEEVAKLFPVFRCQSKVAREASSRSLECKVDESSMMEGVKSAMEGILTMIEQLQGCDSNALMPFGASKDEQEQCDPNRFVTSPRSPQWQSSEQHKEDHGVIQIQDQILTDVQCGDTSILLLCESSVYEPPRATIEDIIQNIFLAYLKATAQSKPSLPINETNAHATPPLEITLAGALMFCRETGIVDNSLSHIDIIQEFYKKTLNSSLAKTPRGTSPQSAKSSIPFSAFFELLIALMKLRYPHAKGAEDVCIRALCTNHLTKLQSRPSDGLRWILQEALSPDLIQVIDSPMNTDLLHQCFAYLSGEGEKEPQDLKLPPQEIIQCMKERPQDFKVQIDILTWFLNQAGVVPTNLLQIVEDKQRAIEGDLSNPANLPTEIPSWWINCSHDRSYWKRTQAEDQAMRAQLLRNTILANYLLKAYRGFPGMQTMVEASMDSFEQGKTVHAATYIEFIEIIAFCIILRGLNLKEMHPPHVAVDVDVVDRVKTVMQKIVRWHERTLHPWKYSKRHRGDDELQKEVDRIFSIFCSLDPVSTESGVDKIMFRKFAKDCKIIDNRVLMAKVDSIFEQSQETNSIEPTEAVESEPQPPAKCAGIGIFFGNNALKTSGEAAPEAAGLRCAQTDAIVSSLVGRKGFVKVTWLRSVDNPSNGKKINSPPQQQHQQNKFIKSKMAMSTKEPKTSLIKEKKTPDRRRSQPNPPDMLAISNAKIAAQLFRRKVFSKTHLNRSQFGGAIRRLGVLKFPKVTSADSSWRMLVERYLAPVAERRVGKFDEYLQTLVTPAVIETISQWEASLKYTFRVYSRMDGVMGYTNTTTSQVLLEQANNTMSFPEFLFMCEEKNVLPGLVNRREIEEVFRLSNFVSGDEKDKDEIQVGGCRLRSCTVNQTRGSALSLDCCARAGQDMNYPQYLDALCLIGLVAYGKPRFNQNHMLPGQKIEALFHYCGLKRSANIRSIAIKNSVNKIVNPYDEWFALSFDKPPSPEESYSLPLISECVIPPDTCPPEVGTLLEQAFESHNESKFDAALSLYSKAQSLWAEATERKCPTKDGRLPADQRLYFVIAMGSVLQSDGQDRKALSLYKSFEEENAEFLEGHPDAGMLHSCVGSVHYHEGEYLDAFKRYVRAKIVRDEAPHLGPQHVDTALACHNLGCTLARLGKVTKAKALVKYSQDVFTCALDRSHPRTTMAALNFQTMETRSFQSKGRGLPGKSYEKASRGSAAGVEVALSHRDRIERLAQRRKSARAKKPGRKDIPCSFDATKRRLCKCSMTVAPGVKRAPCDIKDLFDSLKPEIYSHAVGVCDCYDYKKALAFQLTPQELDPKGKGHRLEKTTKKGKPLQQPTPVKTALPERELGTRDTIIWPFC